MKRIISIIVAIILTAIGLSSCQKEGDGGAQEYTLHLGIAQGHKAEDGKAKFSSTFVAVICDKKGNIVDCVFDATEDTISLAEGAMEADIDLRSKNEQGLEYSMKSASPIGREWYEQAQHFASFIKGRRLDEVDDVDGGEAELMAGCTINISGFKEAIDEADEDENKTTFTSVTIPSVAVAVVSNRDGTKDATSEVDGVAALNSTYSAVAKNGDKIAAAIIEQTENKVNFDDSGVVLSLDKNEGKREMGYGYGMRALSDIGLEWFEQADKFAEYIVGLTPSQVAEIDMNGEYSADDALLAGCTIKINDFVYAVVKTGK